MAWVLGDAYRVQDEVQAGTVPFQLDAVFVRRRRGKLSDVARKNLPSLAAHLSRLTLFEFKGPTDALEKGDLDQFFALAHLFRKQQRSLPRKREMTLVVAAPQITAPFRDDLQRSELSLREHEPAVYSLEGGFFACWVLETDRLAGLAEPILTLFSRMFLQDTRRIIEEWKKSGHEHVLYYVFQQIQQFQRMGERFAMHHKNTEKMTQTLEELKAAVIAERPPEGRLLGLSPEQKTAVIAQLPPEQIVDSLSEDQKRQMLTLLRQPFNGDE